MFAELIFNKYLIIVVALVLVVSVVNIIICIRIVLKDKRKGKKIMTAQQRKEAKAADEIMAILHSLR